MYVYIYGIYIVYIDYIYIIYYIHIYRYMVKNGQKESFFSLKLLSIEMSISICQKMFLQEISKQRII